MTKQISIQINVIVDESYDEHSIIDTINNCMSQFNVNYKDMTVYYSPMWRIEINDDSDFGYYEIVKLPYPAKEDSMTFRTFEDAKKCFVERGYETEEQAEARYYEELG